MHYRLKELQFYGYLEQYACRRKFFEFFATTACIIIGYAVVLLKFTAQCPI